MNINSQIWSFVYKDVQEHMDDLDIKCPITSHFFGSSPADHVMIRTLLRQCRVHRRMMHVRDRVEESLGAYILRIEGINYRKL